MIRIQVSYTDEKELQSVIKQLGSKARNIKRSNNQEGPYKKAYITLDRSIE